MDVHMLFRAMCVPKLHVRFVPSPLPTPFDKHWAAPTKEMNKGRELYDVALSAGGASVAAHRVIIAAAPHTCVGSSSALGGKAQEVELQDVGGRALEKIVDFAHTGETELTELTQES